MANTSIDATNGITVMGQSGTAKKTGYDMDMEDFFKILSAQLQNQTMYDTVDNSEYITQMTQFSMVSQIQAMAANFQNIQALSMIGKEVSLKSANSDGTYVQVTGVADSVAFQNGIAYVGINGLYYDAVGVYQVKGETAKE